jgi:hypothetical protein
MARRHYARYLEMLENWRAVKDSGASEWWWTPQPVA